MTFDTYSDLIKSVLNEQLAARANADYSPIKIADIASVLQERAPRSVADLQAVMLEELRIAALKARSDDVESWRGFFDDSGFPFKEERCRDHLVTILRQRCREVRLFAEEHVAGDREVDIGCHSGDLYLPIEVKGQWHDELWIAADMQLDRYYAPDWRAERRGIYLVLWFGPSVPENKRLKSPPKGQRKPQTVEELRDALAKGSVAALDGRLRSWSSI